MCRNKESYGLTQRPADFAKFWQAARQVTVLPGDYNLHTEPSVAGVTAAMVCLPGDFSAASVGDGTDAQTALQARYLCPAGSPPTAVLVDYHDYGRTARGWWYLSRYLALGYAVLAPLADPLAAAGNVAAGASAGPGGMLYYRVYADALRAVALAKALAPGLPVYLYGEGLGGALALAAATLPGVGKCAVLNPLLADYRAICRAGADVGFYDSLRAYFRGQDPRHAAEAQFFATLDYMDCANFAESCKASLLFGTGLLDEVALPAAQQTVYNRVAGPKTRKIYPKHGHERINSFEDAAAAFFLGG